MLLNPFGNRFDWKFTNWEAASNNHGDAVAAGLSNAEGSWVELASSGEVAQDVYMIGILVAALNTSGQNVNGCLDIGVDPAGGSSYAAVISDIIVGHSPAGANRASADFVFPLFIKAGSSVAVRISTSYGSAISARVSISLYGRPRRPEMFRVGQYAEGIGSITDNVGVSFTPGNTTEGSWASLGATTRPLWWFQISADINSAVIGSQYTWIDLAVGDGTNYDIIIQNYVLAVYGTAEIVARGGFDHLINGFWEVPAGSTLYVRGRCSGSPTSGYNARAIGIGG